MSFDRKIYRKSTEIDLVEIRNKQYEELILGIFDKYRPLYEALENEKDSYTIREYLRRHAQIEIAQKREIVKGCKRIGIQVGFAEVSYSGRYHKKTRYLYPKNIQKFVPRPSFYKRCCNCKKKFKTYRKDQRYCSPYCQYQNQKRSYTKRRKKNSTPIFHKKICVLCGKEFTAKRSDAKTCSNACRQRLNRIPLEEK
jgi:predicted nucleic acid-binding Zn ribbon protein